MAMSIEQLFYGPSESVSIAQYGPRAAASESYFYNAHRAAMPEFRSPRLELITFDLMVPMCCAQCEGEAQDALFALEGVRGVACDGRNQRVTVTGCVDPAQALKQVRRVKNGATFWSDVSSYTAHRYEAASSYRTSHPVEQDDRDRRSYVQLDARERRSYPGQYNRNSSRDVYTRSFCPAYRDAAKTYYVSVNPKLETVVELEC